jgi:hypothetical protein
MYASTSALTLQHKGEFSPPRFMIEALELGKPAPTPLRFGVRLHFFIKTAIDRFQERFILRPLKAPFITIR